MPRCFSRTARSSGVGAELLVRNRNGVPVAMQRLNEIRRAGDQLVLPVNHPVHVNQVACFHKLNNAPFTKKFSCFVQLVEISPHSGKIQGNVAGIWQRASLGQKQNYCHEKNRAETRAKCGRRKKHRLKTTTKLGRVAGGRRTEVFNSKFLFLSWLQNWRAFEPN